MVIVYMGTTKIMNLMLVMVKRLSVLVFQKLLVMIKGLCVLGYDLKLISRKLWWDLGKHAKHGCSWDIWWYKISMIKWKIR
jgi:hypothetical protein